MQLDGFSSNGKLILLFNQDVSLPETLKHSSLQMRDQFKQNITNQNLPIKRRLSDQNVADLSAFIKFETIRGAENSASIDDLGF